MKNALGHPGEVPNSKIALLPDTQPLLFPHSLSLPSPRLVKFTEFQPLLSASTNPWRLGSSSLAFLSGTSPDCSFSIHTCPFLNPFSTQQIEYFQNRSDHVSFQPTIPSLILYPAFFLPRSHLMPSLPSLGGSNHAALLLLPGRNLSSYHFRTLAHTPSSARMLFLNSTTSDFLSS